jgi:uncharacterized phiE125 gp8 family phage protein
MIRFDGIKVKTTPSIEPVTVSQVKDDDRYDDDSFDSTRIPDYIQSSREYVEKYLRRALITTTFEITYPDFCNEFELPKGSLQSVTSIKYYDTDGVHQTLDSSYYQVDTYGIVGRIKEAYGQSFPSVRPDVYNGVIIEYIAGYGDASADVPAPIRRAIISLAIDNIEHAEASTEIKIYDNKNIMRMLNAYRIPAFY